MSRIESVMPALGDESTISLVRLSLAPALQTGPMSLRSGMQEG